MARVIVYDPKTNRVLRYLKSVDASEVSGSILVNPIVPSGTPQDWVYDNGTIRLKTTDEKNSEEQAEQTKQREQTRQEASEIIDGSTVEGANIRALALVMLDEINVLRSRASLPARTKAQLVTAMKNKLSSGAAD